MTVRELVVKLVLDAAGFRSNVDRAQGNLSQLGTVARDVGTRTASSLDRAAHGATGLGQRARDAGQALQQAAERGDRGFGSLLGTLGKVGVALGGMAALKSTIAEYIQATTEIEKTSNMLGMSMEEWQGWSHAAKQAGLQADDVRDRLADLGDWTLDLNVNDSGPLKDFAEKTKTSFKDASGATVSIQEAFFRIADTINGMDRQKATSWLVQMGFDEKTIALFFKGRKGLEEFLKVGKEQAVYSKRDAENARRMQEAWQGLTSIFARLSAAILRTLAPAFDWLAEKSGKLADWVREHEDSLTLFIGVLAAAISRLLVPALWSMASAAWAAILPLTPFILGALALATVIDDLWAFISGGNSVLEKIMRAFGMTDEKIEMVRQTIRNVLAAFKELWDFLTGKGKCPTWLDNMIPDWLKAVFSGGKQAEGAGIGGGSAPGADVSNEDDAVLAAQEYAKSVSYRAGDAARPAGTVNNSRHVETNIGQITVQTQATDADGIARDLGGALQNQTAQADGANGV